MRRLVLLGLTLLLLAATAPAATADLADGAAKPFKAAGTVFKLEAAPDGALGEFILKPVTSFTPNVADRVTSGGAMRINVTPVTEYFRQYTVDGYPEPVSFDTAMVLGGAASVRGRLAELPSAVGQDELIAESVTVFAPQTSATLSMDAVMTKESCTSADAVTCRSSGDVLVGSLPDWRVTLVSSCTFDFPLGGLFADPVSESLEMTLKNNRGDSITGFVSRYYDPSSSFVMDISGTGRFGAIGAGSTASVSQSGSVSDLTENCPAGGHIVGITLRIAVPS